MEPTETESGTLDPQQLRAIELLFEGRTVVEVAGALGIGRTTVWRWRRDPAFAYELANRFNQLRDSNETRLSNLTSKAIGVLEGVLIDDQVPIAVRVKAAAEVLDRNGWNRAADGRRQREEVASYVDILMDTMRSRISNAAWDEMADAFRSLDREDPSPVEAKRDGFMVLDLRRIMKGQAGIARGHKKEDGAGDSW